MIFDIIQALLEEVNATTPHNKEELEQYRLRFIGTKNAIKDVFAEMKNVPNDQKKEFGQAVNQLKQAAEEKFILLKEAIETADGNALANAFDPTAPPEPLAVGSRHPVFSSRRRHTRCKIHST